MSFEHLLIRFMVISLRLLIFVVVQHMTRVTTLEYREQRAKEAINDADNLERDIAQYSAMEEKHKGK